MNEYFVGHPCTQHNWAAKTLALTCFTVFGALAATGACAQDTIKVGLVIPLTGAFASTGFQLQAGARLYLAQNGDKVAGKRVELVVKDDGGVPDTTRRVAQEMIVSEKVVAIAGFGLTPAAFATAPIATQSKTPMVVMAAATSSITERSPYIVRTSFTVPQATLGMAEWASKNGIKKVVTLVSDYGPGIDAETTFKSRFPLNGGKVIGELRVPLASPDFSPFLQRAVDMKPDALFVFLPSGAGGPFMKQYVERGLDKAGMKLIGVGGGMTDDDTMKDMTDALIGTVTGFHYSAAHPSPLNKKFIQGFADANGGRRANYMAVGAYDGMRVIMKALEATKGAGGETLLNAMKGQTFESPRGLVLIDAQTRDIVQDIYIRKVERIKDQLYNVEFDSLKAVKDPGKTGS